MKKNNVLYLWTVFVVASLVLVSSCIPVRLTNRNLDSTYVYLKFFPEEARSGIKEGTIKGTIYVDDALLPPHHSKREGKISRFIIIPHGKHKLTVNVDGYRSWEKEVFFSGNHVTLKIELEKP